MSHKKGFQFGNEDWAEAQQNYWNAWSDMCQKAMVSAAPEKAGNPWAEGLEQWWKVMSGKTPEQSRDHFGRIVEQAQSL